MDKGLEEARKRYSWSRQTLRSFNRDGNCVASVQVDVFMGTLPAPEAKPKAPRVKAEVPDATRVNLLKARTETSRRPPRRLPKIEQPQPCDCLYICKCGADGIDPNWQI